jgi:hypothetical protein
VTIPASDLRVGDRIVLVTRTVVSAMTIGSTVVVQLDSDTVEEFDIDLPLEVVRDE